MGPLSSWGSQNSAYVTRSEATSTPVSSCGFVVFIVTCKVLGRYNRCCRVSRLFTTCCISELHISGQKSNSKPNPASHQAKTEMQQILKSLDSMQQPLYWLNAYFSRFAVRAIHLGVGTWLNRVQLVFRTAVVLPEISGRARLLWKSVSRRRRENSIRAAGSCSGRSSKIPRTLSSSLHVNLPSATTLTPRPSSAPSKLWGTTSTRSSLRIYGRILLRELPLTRF